MSLITETGKLISIMEVVEDDDLMIITDGGIMIRQSVNKLNIIGRNTQGGKLIKLEEKAQIASVTKVIKEDEVSEEEYIAMITGKTSVMFDMCWPRVNSGWGST